jgi:D-alanine-D-alanine ligase
VACKEADLLEAIEFVTREFQQQALVEEFIPGREFAVGLLGNGKSLETLPIVEIDLEGDPNAIQSLDDKTRHPRGKICPAQVPPSLADELCRLARSSFNALGLQDFARVDFRMDADGRLYVLEVNSMASLNVTGSYVHAARAAGVDFDALINRMLEAATIRYFGASHTKSMEDTGKKARNAQMLPARVRSYLRAHSSALVESVEKMVAMNSHAGNVEGVNALGEWTSTRFRALRFRRQILPQTELGDILYFTNHDEDSDDILLLCHFDTVYDLQNHLPLRVERGKLFGSGVAESKGGIAVILFALQALRSARVLKRVRCGVLLTTDDTTGGRSSGKIVAEKAMRARCVVGAKYGDLTGGIVTSCSGMQEYQIELTSNKYVRGRVVPDVVSALSRKVLALRKLGSREDGVSVTIGQMSAQANPGRMADHASATIEARFVSQEQGERLDEIVRLIAEKDTDRALRAQVRFGSRRPAVRGTEASLDFFNRVRELAERLEVRIEAVHRNDPAGICDVPESIPVLGGFGPSGGEVRSLNEFILRDSLFDRAALLALVIHESASR